MKSLTLFILSSTGCISSANYKRAKGLKQNPLYVKIHKPRGCRTEIK